MDETEQLKFLALGGGSEVGRSCHIIQYKGKTVMLDAGVHPGHAGLASLPFYDEFDLSTVDVLLISHFHLDHAASLPYVMQHTNFKGRVFMTHPTKAIYRWLLNDFVKVTSIADSNDEANTGTLYTDEDLNASFDRIETIDYHSTLETDGIRFTAYHAGHVLGAAMYLVEIAGVKVFFTGDYSREEDRHLAVAEVPPVRPDVLITESTFGTATHEPRLAKERKLTNLIHSTLSNGGRCLLPVFALGRAQELLLILDEYWEQNPDLESIQVYYASNLARKCMAVYQTYVNMMNEHIRNKFRDSNQNPFQFKFIKSIRNLDRFDDLNPCVVLASPGMLQNGVSRELLERWASDSRNAVILTGYSIEGTMAKTLLTEPMDIPSFSNPDVNIPRRIQIEEISFAAHVDYEQNSKFIELVNPKSIILVHGESNPMGRLKSALLSKYQAFKGTENEVKVYNPRNCDEVCLKFKTVKLAKALGRLVEEIPREILGDSGDADGRSLIDGEMNESVGGDSNVKMETEESKLEKDSDLEEDIDIKKEAPEAEDDFEIKKEDPEAKAEIEIKKEGKVEDEHPTKSDNVKDSMTQLPQTKTNLQTEAVISGVLVQKNFDLDLLKIEDLREYSGLTTTILKERQTVKCAAGKELVHWHLSQMFGFIDIKVDEPEEFEALIMDNVKVTFQPPESLCTVEWQSGVINDTIADSVIAILLTVDNSPASVKVSSKQCSHSEHSDSHVSTRIRRLSVMLKAQFGESLQFAEGNNTASITIGKMTAKIDLLKLEILDCTSNVLKGRIENVLKRGMGLVAPLAQKNK